MDIFELLETAAKHNASDLHLVAASPPLSRVQGKLTQLNGEIPLSIEDIHQAFVQITDPEDREIFHQQKELDFGYTLSGVGRLRCNAAQQRGAISLAIRLLPPMIRTIDELELPQVLKQMAHTPRGLLVVTGPTGSGKSTTLAAMINHLNLTSNQHIITIEDPIEYVYKSERCAITQRQLGSDTLSFSHALKHVLRQNPDVIMVGEMRDMETASAVLTIAETGHLVLTTSHAPASHQALERIIDFFAPHERHLAQTRLASLLVAVLCQTLVPRIDKEDRIAAMEILIANPAVKNLIREGKIFQLPNAIRTNQEIGMISMDYDLVNLYRKQIISYETLVATCYDLAEVKKLIGINSTTKRQKKTAKAS